MGEKYIIRCCHCGAEYLPAEIYLPNDFLGKPRLVEKDLNGKIINYFGSNMNMIESYQCDYCNKPFKVEAKVRFLSNSKLKNFNDTYKTKLRKPSLFLSEE